MALVRLVRQLYGFFGVLATTARLQEVCPVRLTQRGHPVFQQDLVIYCGIQDVQ